MLNLIDTLDLCLVLGKNLGPRRATQKWLPWYSGITGESRGVAGIHRTKVVAGQSLAAQPTWASENPTCSVMAPICSLILSGMDVDSQPQR